MRPSRTLAPHRDTLTAWIWASVFLGVVLWGCVGLWMGLELQAEKPGGARRAASGGIQRTSTPEQSHGFGVTSWPTGERPGSLAGDSERLGVYERLGRTPALAVEELGRLRTLYSAELADTYFGVIMSSLLREGAFGEAFQALPDAPEQERQLWLGRVASAWVMREPTLGPRLFSALAGSGGDGAAVPSAFFEAWAKGDCRGLVRLAASLPDGELRAKALSAGLGVWVTEEGNGAVLGALRSGLSDTECDVAVHGLLCRADDLVIGIEAACELARGIGDARLREESLAATLVRLTACDPAQARFRAVEEAGSDEALRGRLLAAIAPPAPTQAD